MESTTQDEYPFTHVAHARGLGDDHAVGIHGIRSYSTQPAFHTLPEGPARSHCPAGEAHSRDKDSRCRRDDSRTRAEVERTNEKPPAEQRVNPSWRPESIFHDEQMRIVGRNKAHDGKSSKREAEESASQEKDGPSQPKKAKLKEDNKLQDYECKLCDSKFFTLGQYTCHIQSFEHRKRTILQTADKVFSKAPQYRGGRESDLPPGLSGRKVVHCKVCNVYTNSAKQLAEHLSGGRHKQVCFKFNVPITTLELTSDDTKTLEGTRCRPPTRGSKIRDVEQYIVAKCREHFRAGPKICIDESTVGIKGRVSFKCYNPQKPTISGMRIYALANCQTGYISTFEPYYRSTTTDSLSRPKLPFTCRIVLHVLQKVQQENTLGSGYHL
ncbi:hypothetical protein HPB51_012503 [Rhipicephalus microplus]|uniref:C2H2-type domain-containing protein n=1 Tax=Rhipicephalus microplus TaxID=6941 RepID=A0A9J6DG02_RHIMP|nr:hypothetical protein HPB51_012503 [Rhipicephalus microplus]